MNEQKSSVPEQSEPEQVTEAQEQQTASEQESQSSEQDTTEQIDYKSELEKANSRIAELEKKYIMQYLYVNPDDYDEILPKAMKFVDEETSLEEAFSLLSTKYPDKIRLRPHIDMGGSTKGIPLGSNRDAFTAGLSGVVPNHFGESVNNTNSVKDRRTFFDKK